jgi:hypothetical protein
MLEILHRYTKAVLYSGDHKTTREAVEAAVKSGANLSWAYLSGANLYGADLSGANLSGAYLYGADLSGANLSGAYLYGADLYGANLYGADLYGAYLSGAYLYGAYLSGANLSGAYLSGADLYGAKGFSRERCMDLLMLLDQPGAIRAYKLVDADGGSPIAAKNGHERIIYEIGKEYAVKADESLDLDCSFGLHVATLPWVIKSRTSETQRILLVEFTAADIASIPNGTDGKFRVHRLKVVGEKDISAMLEREEAEAAEYEAKKAQVKSC